MRTASSQRLRISCCYVPLSDAEAEAKVTSSSLSPALCPCEAAARLPSLGPDQAAADAELLDWWEAKLARLLGVRITIELTGANWS